MQPDSYTTAVVTKWESISIVDPLEFPLQRISQVHPGAPPFGEGNGRLLVPFLGVAAFVRTLRYLLS